MMSCSQLKTADDLIASFDEHLRRVRGVCLRTKRNYGEYVDQSLVAVFSDGLANPMGIPCAGGGNVRGSSGGPLPP